MGKLFIYMSAFVAVLFGFQQSAPTYYPESGSLKQVQDTMEKKVINGKEMFFIYKTTTGKTLTLHQKDSLLKAHNDHLGQSFSFSKNIVTIIYSVPGSSEYEQVKKTADDASEKQTVTIKEWLNKPMTNYLLTDIHGKKFNLHELKGKVVVLNFWFTTCKPCIEEMPALNKLVDRYSSVSFISLALDSREKVMAFLKKQSFTYRAIPAVNAAKDYKVQAWPTHMIIDKNMVVRFVRVGGGENIDKLLGEEIDKLSK